MYVYIYIYTYAVMYLFVYVHTCILYMYIRQSFAHTGASGNGDGAQLRQSGIKHCVRLSDLPNLQRTKTIWLPGQSAVETFFGLQACARGFVQQLKRQQLRLVLADTTLEASQC